MRLGQTRRGLAASLPNPRGRRLRHQAHDLGLLEREIGRLPRGEAGRLHPPHAPARLAGLWPPRPSVAARGQDRPRPQVWPHLRQGDDGRVLPLASKTSPWPHLRRARGTRPAWCLLRHRHHHEQPRQPRPRPRATRESTLWHELAHVVTLSATHNRMPRWLSEGISVYEERQRDPAWGMKMNATLPRTRTSGRTPSPRSAR